MRDCFSGSERGRYEEKRYSRPGIEALVAFTPFKIIYAKKVGGEISSFVLTFYPSQNFYSLYHENFDSVKDKQIRAIVKEVEGMSGEKSNTKGWSYVVELWKQAGLRQKRVAGGRRILVYRRFVASEFSREKSPYVVFLHKSIYRFFSRGGLPEEQLHKHLAGLAKRGMFAVAEFSYQSLRRPRVCAKGLVLLSHREECPIMDLCPYWRRKSKCGFYRGVDETYAGLYKVFPLIRKVVTSSSYRYGGAVPIAVVGYKGLPLLSVYYDDDLSVVAYYTGIIFKSKSPHVDYQYLHVALGHPNGELPTLGVIVRHTQGFIIVFHEEALKMIVEEVKGNHWVKFKCGLLKKAEINVAKMLGDITIKDSIRLWNTLESVIEDFKKSDPTLIQQIFETDADNELVAFLVIHSLVHAIVGQLRAELGLSPSDLSYIITREDDSSPHWRVYVFEAVSGGYGFLATLSRDKVRVYDIIRDSIKVFSDKKIEELCKPDGSPTSIDAIRDKIGLLCSRVGSSDPAHRAGGGKIADVCSDLVDLVDVLSEIRRNYNVWVHPYTMSRIIALRVPGLYREMFSDVISDILEAHRDFDGNVYCGFLEDGCYYGPFLEPLTVSYSVLNHVGHSVDTIDRGSRLLDLVIEWLKTSRREVKIMTSNISTVEELFRVLEDIAKKKAKVRVLLGKNAYGDQRSCEAARELRERLRDKVEIRILETLHAKTVIVDGLAAIEGSFNLTWSGLTSNIENWTLITNPRDVEERSRRFNEYWSQAKEYSC